MEFEDSSSSERYCCFFFFVGGGGVVRDTREVVVWKIASLQLTVAHVVIVKF